MKIYKYGLTQDKVIYVLECQVLNEKQSPNGITIYEIKAGLVKKTVKSCELEVYSNKTMYSAYDNKKFEFLKALKESSEETINTYLKNAEYTRNLLNEIIKINKM